MLERIEIHDFALIENIVMEPGRGHVPGHGAARPGVGYGGSAVFALPRTAAC